MNNNLEELIYSAMEDNIIDIQIGPEGEKRILRMKIKPFTLIAATTDYAKISQPIRDRFGLIFKLSNYSEEELAKIIVQTSNNLGYKIPKEQAVFLASYAQGTPRIANRLIKRVIDFLNYYNKDIIDNKIIKMTLKSLSIYKDGLTDIHIEYLKVLLEVFDQKFVSLNVLISVLNERKNIIINEIEPLLLSKKFIKKTSKGRMITYLGVNYLLNFEKI